MEPNKITNNNKPQTSKPMDEEVIEVYNGYSIIQYQNDTVAVLNPKTNTTITNLPNQESARAYIDHINHQQQPICHNNI